jgi:predicted nucleic acid-binding protein
MIYLDTSILVSAMTSEVATEASQRRLAEIPLSDMAISQWTRTEFASALAIKLRTGQLSTQQRQTSQALFDRLVAAIGSVWSVEDRHFLGAAELVARDDLGLRAGDALHLAIAIDHSAELLPLDERLAAAARVVAG